MKEPKTPSEREENAIQALISSTLHVRSGDVTMDEIQPYVSNEIVLATEDETALKNRKTKSVISPLLSDSITEANTVDVKEFMALHRKRPECGFSTKTEEAIKRKREELLDKLRKKKGCD